MSMDGFGNLKQIVVSGFVHFGVLIVANTTCSLSSHSDFEKDTESILVLTIYSFFKYSFVPMVFLKSYFPPWVLSKRFKLVRTIE